MKLYKILFSLLLVGPLLFAQDFRATITGQVTDPSGAAIPGASVKAIRQGTSEAAIETVTNEEGIYTLPYVNPGTYTIEAHSTGFVTLRREGIVVNVADRLNLALKMQLGAQNQEITVVGEQEIINTATANRGLVFDEVKTQELPLNGRQSYMLMTLTPGVLFTQEQFGANGFSGTRGWDVNGEYRINGSRTGTNQFLLNGAPISTRGSWQLAPNVEAIQEFKVMTNTYDAQYGRTGGGHVNTTLKSGTNEIHGSLFDYWRNSVLDANTLQNNRVGAPKGKHNTHQFGGVVGMPIRKDKDFIFGSFEGFREVVPFPLLTSTPPMDIRDGQNFSKYGITVYDPLTTRPCVKGRSAADNACIAFGGVNLRDPFPGNVIPQDRMSPIGRKILSLYPAPNSNLGALTNNFVATGNTGRYVYNQPMGRWDHVFGPNDRLYTVVTFQHGWEDRSGNGFPPPAERGDIRSERTNQNYIAAYTHVFSPTTLLDVRASFGRFTSYFPNGARSFGFTYDQLGIKTMPIPPTVNRNTAPVIRLQQYPDIIGTSYSWDTDNQLNFAPSVTTTRGRHIIRYGFEWAHIGLGNGNPGLATGQLDFNDAYWTQQYSGRNRGYGDGSGIASLLLGVPNGGQMDYNDSFYRKHQYYAGYIQDDWKVNNRLTVNMGLRYDVWKPMYELHNRINLATDFTTKSPISDQVIARWNQLKAEYDAANPGQTPYPNPPAALYGGRTFAGVNGNPRSPYDTDWTNIQPRFGFALRVLENTVLRGGFGIYHRFADQGSLTNGFNVATLYNRSQNGLTPSAGLTGPYSLENPFPDGVRVPQGSALGLMANIGNDANYDGRNRPIPRSYQYSFGFEQALPWNMVLESSYAGNKTVHEVVSMQLNDPALPHWDRAAQDGGYFGRQVPNPFYGILPNTSQAGASQFVSAIDLMKPYPHFRSIASYINPFGWYRYDGLQTKLEKRMLGDRSKVGAMTFVFSHTWSKAMEANHYMNWWNFDREKPIKELDYQDKTQVMAFAGVWDLPVGKGRRFSPTSGWADVIAGGWTANWMLTYSSGNPVNRPDAYFNCGNQHSPNQSYDQWFNNDPGCYTQRPWWMVRNYDDRFAQIRNPNAPQLNFALAKNFRVTERFGLQFRGEAFNITNTPIRPGPNTDWWNREQFGKIPAQQNNFPRLIQLALKVTF